MIYYGCPKCKTPMASPDSTAGQTEKCPSCGNVTVVPSSAPAPTNTSQAALPVVDVPATGNREEVLFKASPAMFRNNPIGFIICLLLTPVVIGLIFLLVWWLDCKGTILSVLDDHTRLRKGILARHTNEVRHVDVRNIRVKQGFFQRIFGVGTIEISTAGQGGIEISVSGIPHPRRAVELVRQRQR